MSVNNQPTEEQTEEMKSNETEAAQHPDEAVPSTEAASESNNEAPVGDFAEQSIDDPRLLELKKEADENYQRYLRVQADFDNFRRRTQKEKEELGQYASMKLITQLLPIVDNFERALAAAKGSEDNNSLSKGVEMIFRQLDQVLEQEGLKPMETVGQPFNPEYHQAIMQVESEEHEEGTIVEEVQKGYMLKDKVLRPAMVKVSS
ncbi:nucleotide exchange factor GrpE [Paenibacillus abyssi]|uniref:Protein GrpE n=1 Tax=Paenibacillus abyssi TaxID=1340531 RepID=A0A917D4U3_9BACL|nr:nucleotide exchange factor GrpE [Paenibacillus abyssi]GGG10832.1 nucleotide exchange factor GrpE [Paenibacillus abyssi]